MRAIGKVEHWQKCQSKVSESDFVGRPRGSSLLGVAVSSDSLNHLRSAVTVERCFVGRGDR